MPRYTCTCCNDSVPEHLVVLCCKCKKTYKNVCVDLSAAEVRVLNSKKGLTWTCRKCSSRIGNDVNDLNAVLIKLQEEIINLKSQIKPATSTNVCVEEVVQEITDRQKRNSNLLVFGFPEHKSDVPKDTRIAKDTEFVRTLLNFLGPPTILATDQLKFIRVGTFSHERSCPRPIKVFLKDEYEVRKFIRHGNKLKDCAAYEGVSVAYDRTQMQIDYYRKLKAELTDRIGKGEENIAIKYVKGMPKILPLN